MSAAQHVPRGTGREGARSEERAEQRLAPGGGAPCPGAGNDPKLSAVRVVYSPRHQLHDPLHDIEAGFAVPMVERAERATRILEALHDFEICGPTQHGLAPIEAVHAGDMVRFLASPPSRDELFPDTVIHSRLREGM